MVLILETKTKASLVNAFYFLKEHSTFWPLTLERPSFIDLILINIVNTFSFIFQFIGLNLSLHSDKKQERIELLKLENNLDLQSVETKAEANIHVFGLYSLAVDCYLSHWLYKFGLIPLCINQHLKAHEYGSIAESHWDRFTVFEFPSRKSFAELITNGMYYNLLHPLQQQSCMNTLCMTTIPLPESFLNSLK